MKTQQQRRFGGVVAWTAAGAAALAVLSTTVVLAAVSALDLLAVLWVVPVLVVVPGGTMVVVSHVVRRRMTAPMAAIGTALSEAAEGNLSARVEVRRASRTVRRLVQTLNEELIGGLQITLLGMRDLVNRNAKIGDAFREETDRAREATEGIRAAVQTISEQIASLDERLARSAGAVEQIAATVRSMAGQVQHQSNAVEQTASAVEQTAASIESVATIAQNRGDASRNLLEVTGTGEQRVQDVTSVVQTLAQGIDDMLGIVSVINTVAAQTNLLAMNAAIEAAHAGEYGRGFAVVAEEIRSLAESTAGNTKKISTSLKGYVRQIRDADAASTAAGASLAEIRREVQSFVDAFTEISQGTREAAAGTREIVTMVHDLSDITGRIDEAAREMDTGVQDITEGLSSVRDFSRETRQRMEVVDGATRQGGEAQERIAEHARQNSGHLHQLQTELRFFILHSDSAEASYNAALRRIILDHKRRAMGARLVMEQQLSPHQIPPPLDGPACPLGALITRTQSRGDTADSSSLADLQRDHSGFHELYNRFLAAYTAGDTDLAAQLVQQVEDAWHRLVPYREVVNRLFDGETP